MKTVRILLAIALVCVGPGLSAQRGSSAQSSAVKAEVDLKQAEAAMLGDPRKALALTANARRVLGAATRDKASMVFLAQALWLEGEAYGRLGEVPAAERALAQAHSVITEADPNGRIHARIVLSRGATAFDKGEVQIAFTNFSSAFGMFQKLGDSRSQAIALQSMGLIFIDAGDYQRALRYYAQSAEIHPGDRNLIMSAYINRALAFKEMGELDASARDYAEGLALAREVGSASYETTILANLAEVELARGRIDAASRYADRGIALGRSGAGEILPFVWAVKARIAWRRGDLKETIALLPKAFGATPLTETSYIFRDVHQTASDAYLQAGDYGLALAHLRAVNRLDAEAREIRSSANAALMAARFDFSSQELQIARRDAALAQSQARTQWIALSGSLLLLAASLVAFFWISRSRNQTRAANVQLSKALAAKSEFLATTSHEIRTPLNGIMGMTQVLMHTPGVGPEVQERIALIDGAGKAMKAIVDDLLDMAKIEAGEIVIERNDVALPALLQETATLWTAEASAKGVEIVAELTESPARIVEDERKLRQIVFNLVSNAVKFTEDGQVTLSARAEADRLIIRVADTGIGIPADQLEAIFEAFHQVDGATTRQYSGTGLGLSISNKLASELGGAITVQSEEGRGSCFKLTLPLTLSSICEPERPDAVDLSLATARVLLVDSNPMFQSFASAALEDVIGTLATAGSFADALGMGQFDLLIVDQATLGEAPLDILADAAGTSRVLTLAPPGAEPGGTRHVIAKQMPPLNIAPALEALLDEQTPVKIAA